MHQMASRGTYTEYLPDYTIGPQAFNHISEVTARFGQTVVIIGGKTALEKAKPKLSAAFESAGITVTDWLWYGGQATHANATRLAHETATVQADMIFAVGGGRVVDTCKETATIADKPLFTVPTLASNCAAVTSISVFYKEDGSLDTYFLPPGPPQHCFIDTEIIADSPREYFWAGIGDALSKGPEVELTTRDVNLVHSPLMARALASVCDEPLYSQGKAALEDQSKGIASEAFENVALDIIISTGICSNLTTNLRAKQGGYYFNSTVAHAFYNAYTTLGERAHRHLHGEVVSFGVCVLRAFDDQVEGLKLSVATNQNLGLPITLQDIELSVDDIDQIVEFAQTTSEWGRAPYGFTVERFTQAILDADAYGRAVKSGDVAEQDRVLAAVHAHRATKAVERRL